MKEIKAYIRPTFLEGTIAKLEGAGARDITVIRVDAIGHMADHEEDRKHFFRKYNEKYCCISKLEIVCRDEEAPVFIDIIKRHAKTGKPGDGRIFQTNVERAVRIRTGDEGEGAL